MIYNRGKFDWLIDILIYAFMIVMMVLTLYPFYYVAVASISDPFKMMQHRGVLVAPLRPITFDSYSKVIFSNQNIATGYKNTLIYVFGGLAVNLSMTVLAAYAMSRKTLELRNIIMFFITFTMLFSGGMIPSFLLVRSLGMINTRWAIIVPTAISVYNMIILRTNFQAIPDSLDESARIDGANDFVILIRIVLPLSQAAMAVMVLYYGVSHWNSWFPAMIYLRQRELYPLQTILREILISNDLNTLVTGADAADRAPLAVTIQYATIIVSTLPILAIYPFLQRYFVKGVMIGAIKG